MASSAILDFKIFATFVRNSNCHLFLHWHAKFGEDRAIYVKLLCIFDFQNGSRPPSWV